MKKSLLLFTIIVLTQFTNAFAQTKIGYINVDEIFALMPETTKADSSLAAYQKELSEAYAQQEKELNDDIEKFIKDSVTMTAVAREVKRNELQSRVTKITGNKKEFSASMERAKENQVRPIREKLLSTIKAVAKENGYGHILYKEQAIVFPETDDITALVKKKLGIK